MAERRGRLGAAVARRCPFVYVFGRSHFAVSYYGANVYPENVTVGLEQPADQRLGHRQVRARGAQATPTATRTCPSRSSSRPAQTADAARERVLAESIRAQLQRLNSEFAALRAGRAPAAGGHAAAGRRPGYFPVGVKHRYTRGTNDRS